MKQSQNHKMKGYYSFVATLFSDQKHKGAVFNINQSWLPLTHDNKQLKLIDKYKDSSLIPVLSERSYMQIILSLSRYAKRHNWLMQSVLVRVRPHAFDELSEEIKTIKPEVKSPYSITAIKPLIRAANIQERTVIEAHNQSERLEILEELDKIIFHYLHKEGLYADDDIVDHQARVKVSTLLSRYPFLVYAIFKHLPKLNVLYYTTNMENKTIVTSMIRLNNADCIIDEKWRHAEQVMDVVL